jgi:hypothetical protein
MWLVVAMLGSCVCTANHVLQYVYLYIAQRVQMVIIVAAVDCIQLC